MTIVVAEQYVGPARQAHGGYLAGLLVDRVGSAVVTLLEPVPVETELVVELDPVRARVLAADRLVATASRRTPPFATLPAVDASTARAAEERFREAGAHPFPTCFVCGTDPDRPLALGVAPGPIGGGAACTWTPHPALGTEDGVVPAALLRAVLDCPGGWALDPVAAPVVLSTFAAEVGTVRVGERQVVVAAVERRRGRTALVHTAMYGPDGRRTGRARATWLTVDTGAKDQ